MNAPRPKKAHARAFKITCSILFFCGLRWNEVALLNRENIEEILNQTKLSVYQKKVDKFRNVRFIEKSISFIKKAFEQHGDNVFADNWDCFYVVKTKRRECVSFVLLSKTTITNENLYLFPILNKKVKQKKGYSKGFCFIFV
jgi:hypothetical protein